jgi:hypothetical protein
MDLERLKCSRSASYATVSTCWLRGVHTYKKQDHAAFLVDGHRRLVVFFNSELETMVLALSMARIIKSVSLFLGKDNFLFTYMEKINKFLFSSLKLNQGKNSIRPLEFKFNFNFTAFDHFL